MERTTECVTPETPPPPASRPEKFDFYAYAAQEQCLRCPSYCCRLLLLDTLSTGKWADFDYMRFLLGFEGMAIVVTRNRNWKLYFRRVCEFLDPDTDLCTRHGTASQPIICRDYNPYTCWYRRADLYGQGSERPRLAVLLDRTCLEAAFRRVRFDADGRIVHLPDVQELEDLAVDPSAEETLGSPGRSSEVWGERRAGGPCRTCPSTCCRHLYFRRKLPKTYLDLNFFRYMAGFLGVALELTHDSWWIVVETDCRHLDLETGDCRLYGKPERPRHCVYWCEWNCGIRKSFGGKGSPLLRLKESAQFDALRDIVVLDDEGGIMRLPTYEQVEKACVSH
jgi:hypothetical protein